MLLYKYIIYLFLLLLVSCSSDQKNFSFNVDFQSGSLFKSQALFLNNLSKTKSRGEIESLIAEQDWILYYSIKYEKDKKVNISIENKVPIFILNDKYYVDKNFSTFKYDNSNLGFIKVFSPIDEIKNAKTLIDFFEILDNKYMPNLIEYSYTSGWIASNEKTRISMGKILSNDKLIRLEETINYLNQNTKIPSMIDVRYKDGIAIKGGKFRTWEELEDNNLIQSLPEVTKLEYDKWKNSKDSLKVKGTSFEDIQKKTDENTEAIKGAFLDSEGNFEKMKTNESNIRPFRKG